MENISLQETQKIMNMWLEDDSTGVLEPDQESRNLFRSPPSWPEVISPRFIEDFLKYIDSIKGDSEAAHIFEDELHSGVLAAIAEDRCCNPDVCAKKALGSHFIPFKRDFG